MKYLGLNRFFPHVRIVKKFKTIFFDLIMFKFTPDSFRIDRMDLSLVNGRETVDLDLQFVDLTTSR